MSKVERGFVLSSYRSSRRPTSGFRFFEYWVAVLMILAELIGLIGGWIFWHGFWGAVAGAICAMLCVAMLGYATHVCASLWKLHRFFRSEFGRFILDRAKDYEAFIQREERKLGT
jgi:hypothetical protein